jgi:hypothetical protein
MTTTEGWNEWAWRMRVLEDCPESEIAELKEAIFAVWSDPEKRAYWEARIEDEARFSMELKAMGSEANARVRASVALERADRLVCVEIAA